MLENQGYATTFGDPAADPYLATALPAQGALLTQYYGTGHFSNDNYVSFVSGQPPNPSNQADCPIFTDFSPATISAGGSRRERAASIHGPCRTSGPSSPPRA